MFFNKKEPELEIENRALLKTIDSYRKREDELSEEIEYLKDKLSKNITEILSNSENHEIELAEIVTDHVSLEVIDKVVENVIGDVVGDVEKEVIDIEDEANSVLPDMNAWISYQYAIYPAPIHFDKNAIIEIDSILSRKISILSEMEFKTEEAKDLMFLANLETMLLVRKATVSNMDTTLKKIKIIFDKISESDEVIPDTFNQKVYVGLTSKEAKIYAENKGSLRTKQRRKKKSETNNKS